MTKGFAVTISPQDTAKLTKSGAPHTEPLLTLWCLEQAKPLTSVKPPLQSIKNLQISPDQSALCLSGKDNQGRELILIYSFQDLVKY